LPHEANTALDSLIDLFRMTQLIKKVKNSKSHRAIRKQLLVKFRIHTTQRQKSSSIYFAVCRTILPLSDHDW